MITRKVFNRIYQKAKRKCLVNEDVEELYVENDPDVAFVFKDRRAGRRDVIGIGSDGLVVDSCFHRVSVFHPKYIERQYALVSMLDVKKLAMEFALDYINILKEDTGR